MITPDEVLTVEEAAPYLRAKPIRVRRLCASGELPAIKQGNRWRILRSSIEAYLTPKPAPVADPLTAPVYETASERRQARRGSGYRT